VLFALFVPLLLFVPFVPFVLFVLLALFLLFRFFTRSSSSSPPPPDWAVHVPGSPVELVAFWHDPLQVGGGVVEEMFQVLWLKGTLVRFGAVVLIVGGGSPKGLPTNWYVTTPPLRVMTILQPTNCVPVPVPLTIVHFAISHLRRFRLVHVTPAL